MRSANEKVQDAVGAAVEKGRNAKMTLDQNDNEESADYWKDDVCDAAKDHERLRTGEADNVRASALNL